MSLINHPQSTKKENIDRMKMRSQKEGAQEEWDVPGQYIFYHVCVLPTKGARSDVLVVLLVDPVVQGLVMQNPVPDVEQSLLNYHHDRKLRPGREESGRRSRICCTGVAKPQEGPDEEKH